MICLLSDHRKAANDSDIDSPSPTSGQCSDKPAEKRKVRSRDHYANRTLELTSK
jgi:hypothetical protein